MTKTELTLSLIWTILVYTLVLAIVFTDIGAIGLDVFGAFWSGAPGDFPWEDIFSPDVAETMYDISHDFEAARNYFAAVWDDGDYLNDWLTHLPKSVQKPVLWAGITLSEIAH